jgi:protein arginine N-methyltransferase 1
VFGYCDEICETFKTQILTYRVVKVVLDVGAGSGILAIWSAQAGAKKVYAVEATKMSEHARALVKANNLEQVVEVIEGSVEDITLPEKG